MRRKSKFFAMMVDGRKLIKDVDTIEEAYDRINHDKYYEKNRVFAIAEYTEAIYTVPDDFIKEEDENDEDHD